HASLRRGAGGAGPVRADPACGDRGKAALAEARGRAADLRGAGLYEGVSDVPGPAPRVRGQVQLFPASARRAALPPDAVVSTQTCRSIATCARSGMAVIKGRIGPGRAASARP